MYVICLYILYAKHTQYLVSIIFHFFSEFWTLFLNKLWVINTGIAIYYKINTKTPACHSAPIVSWFSMALLSNAAEMTTSYSRLNAQKNVQFNFSDTPLPNASILLGGVFWPCILGKRKTAISWASTGCLALCYLLYIIISFILQLLSVVLDKTPILQ